MKRDESSSATRDPLDHLANEYFELQRAGNAPDLETWLASRPEHADALREMIPALAALQDAVAPRHAAVPQPGSWLGDFRLLREVGRGGMGVVFEAIEEPLQRRVALKVLPFQALLDSRLRERFDREAKAAARLDHPNIVPVYGAGEAGGVPYFAMRFVDGRTLDVVLSEIADRNLRDASGSSVADTLESTSAAGPYFRVAARIARDVARALVHAHEGGVIHRDIKPGNLILDRDGEVHVADFGLCKADDLGAVTRTTDVLGTLRYMAPEQVQGHADARSDIYSLGATLYEMVTRRSAHPGEDRIALARAVVERQPVAPRRIDRRIPRDLETIILKAIDKDPAFRYATAGDLADDLDAFLKNRPISGRRPSLVYLLRLAARRHRKAVVAATVAVLLAVGGIALYIQSLNEWRRAETAQRIEVERQSYFARIAAAQGALALGQTGYARQHLDQCRVDQRHWEWNYLAAQLDNSTLHRAIGRSGIRDLTLSSDGDTLVAACDDGRVYLVDPKTLEVRHALRHPHAVRGIAFVGDSNRLATACFDGDVRVWNVATGVLEFTLSGQKVRLFGIASDPDGKLLIATGSNGSVQVWDVATRELRSRLEGHKGFVWRASVHPQGNRVATSGSDNTVRIWRMSDGECLDVLPHPGGEQATTNHSLPVRYSPDGAWLASGDQLGNVILRDASTHEIRMTLEHDVRAWDLRFLPNDQLVVTYFDRSNAIWDLRDQKIIQHLRGQGMSATSVTVSADGLRVFAGSYDGVRVWTLPARPGTRTIQYKDKGALCGTAISETLLATATGSDVVVWDALRGTRQQVLQGNCSRVNSLASTPDGAVLMAGDRAGHIVAWNLPDGTMRWQASPKRGCVEDLDVSADGTVAAACSIGLGVQLYSVHDGSVLRTIEIAGNATHSARLFPDGKRVATSHSDGRVIVWSIDSGKPLLEVPGDGRPSRIAVDPKGLRIASSQFGGGVRIVDARDGRILATMTGHLAMPYWPAFSPDGSRLATAGRDGSVRLWDTDTGAPLLTLTTKPEWLFRTVFSPDGTWLAVTGTSRIMLYYSPETQD